MDAHFHPGLPQLFDDLRGIVEKYRTIAIQFYIVSGSLQAIIEGSAIVRKYFAGVYGCLLDDAGSPPLISHIRRAITFTEKTRFLFEINKGLIPDQTLVNPYLVNKKIPPSKRPVPFQNIIYIGDGLTDIPCFSTVKALGGTPFGVADPTNVAKAKRAFLEFLKTDRAIGMYRPSYGPDVELGAYLRAAVSARCNQIMVAPHTAEQDDEG